MSKKTKNITMRVGLISRLESKHVEELQKRPTQTSEDLGAFINDLLTDVLDKDEFLRIYAPAISFLDVHDNILYLKDSRIKTHTVEIFLKKEELWCDHDKSGCCEHIRYAFAIPEIARLNLRKPREIKS